MMVLDLPEETAVTLRPLAFVAALLASPALAEDLAQPTGPVLLTIDGAIAHTNADGQAQFDRAMLEALPVSEFATTTIWTDGTPVFTGVPLNALLDSIGADGTLLRAVALNDYGVEIPVADAVDDGPIVAYEQDGAPMTVRNKGPLWIVYPYDTNPEYQTEVIYARSIWQLHRIEVLP